MTNSFARTWECPVCGYVYDEGKEGVPWADLPDDWECPRCGASKSLFQVVPVTAGTPSPSPASQDGVPDEYLRAWARGSDDVEPHMADIHRMAVTGESIIEPMRARRVAVSWDDILIKGAQLASMPLNKDEPVNTKTVIGPKARHPLEIDTPIYVTHMSFGALSREVKIALAKGSAAARTAMCSGEGGILPESLANAHKYIFEYVPNRYSVTDEYLRRVDAVEIKVGQSAKPGMGGHLPGSKVTKEIAEIRGFPVGTDIHSPARLPDIGGKDNLKAKVA